MSKKQIKTAILELKECVNLNSFRPGHKKARILELLNNALNDINKNDININLFIDAHSEVMTNCRSLFIAKINIAEELHKWDEEYNKNLEILDAIVGLFEHKLVSARKKALAENSLIVHDDEIRDLYEDIIIDKKTLGNTEETIRFFQNAEKYIIAQGYPELLAFYIINAKRIGTYKEALVAILKDKRANDPTKKLEIYNQLYKNSISFAINTE